MMWWIISILVVTCIGVLLFCTMTVSKKADRNQRHAMHDLMPFEDVTITRF
jgi:heme/copper-type cytochrome/quinol oxidase subunit 2